MKENIQGITRLPENEMIISDSVNALLGITMFWQPQMDPNYREQKPKIVVDPLDQEKYGSCVLEKLDRGIIWKQVNERIAKLGIPNTKENRKAIYDQLVDQNPAKIEESL